MATEYRPKRFIAGAVCPKCSEMDKIVMYRANDNEQVRECVRCGFSDIIRDDTGPEDAPQEPPTRVNQPRPGEQSLAHEDEIQVVSLIDPKADGRNRTDH
ncbi:YheV family putative metal-binding protein [Spongiibacter nanhainus]|uniref:YheV family putative metal-binding protein n=1 Tax=Spongiibacter nanhainus TaxID=2794344 RepID=A0A7T4R0T5_9GAMM|nr:YheV family putative zinc ribbon protein [Spongiibacter nanhainus]QQD18330.1 YheV family putative metal-binding protein [Spongiibacter nanhainus]